MVGLLDLPLELREPILVDVILNTTQQRSEDMHSVINDLRYNYVVIKSHNYETPGPIRFRPLTGHAMSLLHINQQIRDEVIELMPRRLGHRKDDAKVDLIYVDEVQWDCTTSLYATWLSAPFPTNHLNTVHAQIRDVQSPSCPALSHPHPRVSVGQDCKFWVDTQSAGMLLNFFARSLVAEWGDASIYEVQSISGVVGSRTVNRTIQNLVVDIPFERDQQESLETPVRCQWCPGAHKGISKIDAHRMIPSGKRAALLFAECLQRQLLHIFDSAPKYWRANTFPCIIFERIGTIDLNVQGILFGRLDLSQILANLPRSEEWTGPAFSRAEFFEWKRATEEKRKLAGFRVVRPSVQEHQLARSAGLIASILAARDGCLVRKVASLSDGGTPSPRQPARNEKVAFTGNALFVQEDGIELPGKVTFYSSTDATWENMRLEFRRPRSDSSILSDVNPEDLEPPNLVEQPKDEEIVLFKGEAILFQSDKINSTITSGDAIFYGHAEEASTEQSGSIKI